MIPDIINHSLGHHSHYDPSSTTLVIVIISPLVAIIDQRIPRSFDRHRLNTELQLLASRIIG